MMRAVILLAVVLPVACSRPPAPADLQPRAALDSIVLERAPCFGICPAYRLRIDRSGNVAFESRNKSDSGTVSRGLVGPWVRDSLATHLTRIGFRQLPDTITGSALCPVPITELSTITVAVFDQHPKQVIYYTGCFLEFDFKTKATVAPSLVALRQFAARMDTLTGAH
jgi:hypothetical protein